MGTISALHWDRGTFRKHVRTENSGGANQTPSPTVLAKLQVNLQPYYFMCKSSTLNVTHNHDLSENYLQLHFAVCACSKQVYLNHFWPKPTGAAASIPCSTTLPLNLITFPLPLHHNNSQVATSFANNVQISSSFGWKQQFDCSNGQTKSRRPYLP